MSDDHPTDLLGALPRARPHRRSDKRPARAVKKSAGTAPSKPPAASTRGNSRQKAPRAKAAGSRPARGNAPTRAVRRPVKRLAQPAQPEGTPTRAPARPPRSESKPAPVPIVTTVVQAAAELAEIGLALGARALRSAVERLPRP